MNFAGGINPPPGGIQTASVTITPAQFRTPGFVVTIVKAVAGKQIIVLGTKYRLNGATVAWTGAASDIAVEDANANIVFADQAGLFQNRVGSWVHYQASAEPSAGNPNDALALAASFGVEGVDLVAAVGVPGSPAGADGSITITVAYFLA